MSTELLHASELSEAPVVGPTSHRGSRWSRFKPHTATLIASMLAIFVLLLVVHEAIEFPTISRRSSWQIGIACAALVILLVIDRLDEWFYRPTPRTWVAVLLLTLRLAACTVGMRQGNFSAALILLTVPYITTSYFGAPAGYLTATLIWTILPFADPFVAIVLIFCVAGAHYVRAAEESRVEAEELLAVSAAAQTRLKTVVERTLRVTQERHHLVRAIHETVDQELSVVNGLLEVVLAPGSKGPAHDMEALMTAKHVASSALQQVRRSVAALRMPSEARRFRTALFPRETEQPIAIRGSQRGLSALRARLAGNPLDKLHSAAYISLAAVYVVVTSWGSVFWSRQHWSIASILLGLFVIDRLEYALLGNNPPVRAGFVIALMRIGLCGLFAATAGGSWSLWVLLFLPHFGLRYWQHYGRCSLAKIVWGAVLAVMGVAVLRATASGPLGMHWSFTTSAVFVGFVAVFVLFGFMTSRAILGQFVNQLRIKRLMEEIQRANQEIKVSAEREIGAVEERNHLARDIHDGLGHYLTVINVQLEKALAFLQRDPAVARQAMHDAMRLTGEALRDVRTSAGALSATKNISSLSSGLQHLVGNVTGMLQVDLRITGEETGFARQVLMALYRVVQEGLTNVQKHAGAHRVAIRLAFHDDRAELDLCDDGRGFEIDALPAIRASSAGGYGLQGLRERIELVGGTLKIESAPGLSTRLHVVVPKHGLGLVPRPDDSAEERV